MHKKREIVQYLSKCQIWPRRTFDADPETFRLIPSPLVEFGLKLSSSVRLTFHQNNLSWKCPHLCWVWNAKFGGVSYFICVHGVSNEFWVPIATFCTFQVSNGATLFGADSLVLGVFAPSVAFMNAYGFSLRIHEPGDTFTETKFPGHHVRRPSSVIAESGGSDLSRSLVAFHIRKEDHY